MTDDNIIENLIDSAHNASDTQYRCNFGNQMKLKNLIIIGMAIVSCSIRAAQMTDLSFMIEFKDHHFFPQNLAVPAGRPIRIKVVNSSRETIEFESFSLNRERAIKPGESIIVRIPALRPGTYDFFDDFHQDVPEGAIVSK